MTIYLVQKNNQGFNFNTNEYWLERIDLSLHQTEDGAKAKIEEYKKKEIAGVNDLDFYSKDFKKKLVKNIKNNKTLIRDSLFLEPKEYELFSIIPTEVQP